MGRKILTKKNILRFVYFSVVIILGNVDFYLIKSGIAKGTVNAFKWLFNFINQGVPYFFKNLLIVVVLGFLVFVIIKIRELSRVYTGDLEEEVKGSEEDIVSFRKDFENHKKVIENVLSDMDEKIGKNMQSIAQIYDKVKKYEEIEIKEEYIFILETAGAQADKTIDKGVMKVLYMQRFRFSTGQVANLSFNMNINWLDINGYISQFKTETDTEGIEEHIQITDKGFEYLRLVKIKIEEENKEEDTT